MGARYTAHGGGHPGPMDIKPIGLLDIRSNILKKFSSCPLSVSREIIGLFGNADYTNLILEVVRVLKI